MEETNIYLQYRIDGRRYFIFPTILTLFLRTKMYLKLIIYDILYYLHFSIVIYAVVLKTISEINQPFNLCKITDLLRVLSHWWV